VVDCDRRAIVRDSRDLRGVGFRAMGEKFVPSDKAKEIADALKGALDALVELYDAENETYHLAMSTWWFSHRDHYDDRVPGGCRISARINDRWTLFVANRPFLHPDAPSLAKWAARQLEAHLPRAASLEALYPSPGRGGGSSGPAEIGIPISWVRQMRR
jgi:hypothetical protein